MQSTLRPKTHLAVIMDGNGRWATNRGLPRSRGHEAGARAVRPVVEAATEAGIGTLTLYAFSSDNWRRPGPEVAVLMGLLHRFLAKEIEALADSGVRLNVIGRRDRLPSGLAARIAAAEAMSAGAARLHLRIAVDYSSRDALLEAARRAEASVTRETFGALVAGAGVPDVDLLVRTGGERRLSDFLLWECAYAELRFVDRLWPDFGRDDLTEALADLRSRQRRFGGLPAAAEAA
ncbi:di-trans,poly-cis-decaprenylcistransferase [Aureimonas pseudogalii]|uniref:Isoprenyl transferase n=1 Tax=Aureimonas pseudogalii TaxID=1744844 RepID=A0A7W6H2T8_9HYPH|nr:di-trans,poly-cis-decaprenylcistransferase [Aureimonas pseudogalii]MBB3996437.1 undecaprenyl diphosphate synthase [Aureimonas pseudogalii]